MGCHVASNTISRLLYPHPYIALPFCDIQIADANPLCTLLSHSVFPIITKANHLIRSPQADQLTTSDFFPHYIDYSANIIIERSLLWGFGQTEIKWGKVVLKVWSSGPERPTEWYSALNWIHLSSLALRILQRADVKSWFLLNEKMRDSLSDPNILCCQQMK